MELKDKFIEYLIIDCKYSDNTIKNYEIIMNKFLNNLKCNNVLKTTKEDILNFIDYDLSIGNSNKTISNNLEVLRTFFKFLEIEDLISDNPMNDIDNPKNAKKIPRVLSVEEVKQILDIDLINAYSYRNKAMIELMYSSGLRISELINVKTYDIDLDIGSIRVMGKGSKERLIPVDDYALYYLKIYIEEYRILLNKKKSDYLFLNNRYEKISRQAFFNIIKDIAIKKNIKSTFSPHTLRHSFASHMVENGADLRSVQELLGHSNISTTQIYTNISDKFVSQNYKHSHPHGN